MAKNAVTENTINEITDMEGNVVGYVRILDGEVSFKDQKSNEWIAPSTEVERHIVTLLLTDIGMIKWR